MTKCQVYKASVFLRFFRQIAFQRKFPSPFTKITVLGKRAHVSLHDAIKYAYLEPSAKKILTKLRETNEGNLKNYIVLFIS